MAASVSGKIVILTFGWKRDNISRLFETISMRNMRRTRLGRTRSFFLFIWLVICLLLNGCASLLPSSKQDVKSPWDTFADAKYAFDQIQIHETTSEDLKGLGYDPTITPNMELLTYLEVVQIFLPNQSIRKEDLDEGVLKCILAKDACSAYEINLKKRREKRFGNVFLDLFGFRRQTKISGWEFRAIVVMHDDLVVYKISGGKPNIDELRDEKKPLGPLQDSGAILRRIVDL